MPFTVALDRCADDARPYIEKAAPTHPSVIDTEHRVAELDHVFNVPTVVWIDEALTPESSRFWPRDGYQAGRGQPSFDKQFVRDYLETLDWDKTPPPPPLPAEIIERTRAKYRQVRDILLG